MSKYGAVGIDTELAREIRSSGLDAFGGKAEVWTATGPGLPCRHCLQEAWTESKVLLISHQPLLQQTPFAGRGPIFICAEDCAAFEPEQTVPAIVASRKINLRAYEAGGKMIYRHSRIVEGSEAEDHIVAMLGENVVEEVHAHTALHGCFLCKFVRRA